MKALSYQSYKLWAVVSSFLEDICEKYSHNKGLKAAAQTLLLHIKGHATLKPSYLDLCVKIELAGWIQLAPAGTTCPGS